MRVLIFMALFFLFFCFIFIFCDFCVLSLLCIVYACSIVLLFPANKAIYKIVINSQTVVKVIWQKPHPIPCFSSLQWGNVDPHLI